MSRKVFTAGEVLAAADVNTFLMDQTVMSFAGTAARGSAIPTPVTGMYTHLEDSAPAPRLQFWNGSAWRSPMGYTLVASSSFTSQPSVSFNNIFTSEFDVYEIHYDHVGSGNQLMNLRLRSGGTDLSSISYGYNFTRAENSTLYGNVGAPSTAWAVGTMRTSSQGMVNITLANPAKAVTAKTYLFQSYDLASSVQISDVGGGTNNQGAGIYDGCTIFPSSGTFTGSIRIYGLRK